MGDAGMIDQFLQRWYAKLILSDLERIFALGVANISLQILYRAKLINGNNKL